MTEPDSTDTDKETLTPKYIWKCKCGKFQVKLLGEPLDDINCFCHSCVAPVRYLQEKHPGGTSAATAEGGAAFCQFELTDTLLPPDADDKVGYLKVGEKGKSMRTYTKCCFTQFHMGTGANFPANFRPLNRNGVYKVDGAEDLTPYVPSSPPINGGLKWKFDDVDIDKVPDPKTQFWPISFAMRLFGRIGKYMVGVGVNSDLQGVKMIHATPEDVEVETVPITWE